MLRITLTGCKRTLDSNRLVRWTNAPTTGLELISDNIRQNHQVSPYYLKLANTLLTLLLE